MPDDLEKLSNVVKNDVVEKTEYSSLKTKVDNIDTSGFVTRTKLTTDTNALDDKIDKVEKKIPDVSDLVKKSALTAVENKIPDITSLATKTALTAVENKIPNVTSFVKKTDFDSKITEVEGKKPNISVLATNSSLTAVENKIPHISSLITKTEFDAKLKNVSDRVTNNKSKDLLLDNELKKLKALVGFTGKIKSDEAQEENSFNRGFFYYLQQSYLVCECKMDSFSFSSGNISEWKSTGIYSSDSSMKGIEDTKTKLPELKNDGRMHVYLQGNYFQQNKVITPNNNNVINIYVVYKLDPMSSTRNTDYTIQNALFGAMKITKNTDSSKNNYTGYGLCFDEGGEFSNTVKQGNFDRTTSAKNIIIFGVDTSSSIHATNRTNNIYVMGKAFIQGTNDTTIHAERNFHNNFTEFGVKFVLSLHYNGNNSYLFANGRKELKFKAKDE